MMFVKRSHALNMPIAFIHHHHHSAWDITTAKQVSYSLSTLPLQCVHITSSG